MLKAPVFNRGEQVIISEPADDFYEGKTGTVTDDEYRDYIGQYVYYVRLDNDGYEMEFTADELMLDEE